MKIYVFYRLFTVAAITAVVLAPVYGQHAGQLQGVVKDRQTGQVIEGVTASLRESQQRAKSDGNGVFVFDALPFGEYTIQLSSIGYSTRTLNPILISASKRTADLGEVFLDAVQNKLDEVVITPDPPMVEFGADTITFNASQSMMAEGSAASDMLKSVPMVDVDIDGNPTIAGMLNTRIFINGKPADFTAETIADLMNVLPADMIAKVEVVTNPDVRYAADGDGIINIVLKKGIKLGLTGSASVTAGTLNNYNGSTYVAYRGDSLSINTGYGYRYGTRVTTAAVSRRNFSAGEDTPNSFIDQWSADRNHQQGHNLNTSIDWDATSNQNLTVMANVNATNQTSLADMDDYRLNAEGVQREFRTQRNDRGVKGLNYKINAQYTAKLRGKNERLEAGLVAFSNSRQQDRAILREIERANGTEVDPFNQYMGNLIGNNRLEMNIDYRRSVGQWSTVSFGAQGSFASNDNNQSVTVYDYALGMDAVNAALSNRFRYRETIYATYASYQLRTQTRWSFRAGLRAEGTYLTLTERLDEHADIRPYVNFFPNLSINKVVAKKHRFGLSYSMRLMRPREHMLNPLINDTNPANVSFGNPGLRPAFSHRYQLSYGVATKQWSFTPRLSYAATGDLIERFRISADSVTFLNLASRNELTLNLVGSYKQGKNLTLNWGALISRVDYHSPAALVEHRTGWNRRGNIGASFSLPKRISAECRITYTDRMLSQGRRRSTATADFGVRKAFLNNRLLVRLMATDPFTDQNTMEYIDGITASGATYFQENDRVLRTRNYRLGLSYRFMNAGTSKRGL
ncbi:Outer membrane receptor proteins, mostly Fe transport [Parapedobacter composti]|uniref:Outer membrane receptor proteins, mostly Fe transport n=1 Tax=Parapedobacter composti TaxID=623281 RepID=A0A1I1JH00_9SPHI|nr:outer membrane beta-barrel protein [Parapedobacter composti]SFC45223.1 Outer membrane receptor proteins, mostly Fe transport [Parapedobacter composti]